MTSTLGFKPALDGEGGGLAIRGGKDQEGM